jgi:dTDP-4-dehydrorhamnose reductase
VSARPILLLGGTGQIGFELRRALAPLGSVAAPPRASVDLADPASLRRTVREIAPALIVNAAAYTAVDAAERERGAAFAINAEAPSVLAEEARRAGVALVHYSTDYVFDGAARRPYVEGDATAPLNVYGESKLAGEGAVMGSGAAHLVLRTSWVYAARGRNFLLAMRRRSASDADPIRVVDDQTGAPTWARMIAEATAQILAQRRAGAGGFDLDGCGGLFHVTAAGATTWHGFAAAILGPAGAARLLPIGSAEYGAAACRPRWSVLSNEALRQRFGIALPAWDEQLRLCLEELG